MRGLPALASSKVPAVRAQRPRFWMANPAPLNQSLALKLMPAEVVASVNVMTSVPVPPWLEDDAKMLSVLYATCAEGASVSVPVGVVTSRKSALLALYGW